MSDSTNEDFDWLFDYIVTFLKSPPWTVPLNTFIDENCIIFDSDDDNKLAYTPVHQKFCELVESLLSSNLDAIGVSDEQFVAACEKSQNQEVNKLVFGQIMAVDDFLTFKKMMVKRNTELNLEAMQAYKQQQAAAGGDPQAEEERRRQHAMNNELMPEDEALQMAIALKVSQEEAAMGGSGGGDTDDLDMAVKMSLIEQEISASQYDSEQAELEHAIAMSLALETERLRLVALEAGGGDSNNDNSPSSSSSSSSSQAPPKRTALPTSLPDDPDPAPSPSNAAAASGKSSLPPINMRGRGGGGGGNFDAAAYERDRRELDETLARAQSSFRANASVSAAAKETKVEVAKKANVDDSELARRQKFLRQQRDLILAKKARKRATELADFERAKEEAGPVQLPPSVAARTKPASSSSSSSSSSGDNGGVDDKRAMMRAALASRLKQDYLSVKQRRSYEKASSQFGQLDEQLQQVEQLRAEKQARAQAETAQALEAEYERQRRAQEFHMSLAANAHDDANEI